MSVVDANVILRYLLDDHAELSPKAAEILEQQQTVTLPSNSQYGNSAGIWRDF
jgi:predicted nucleic acid-binding protein